MIKIASFASTLWVVLIVIFSQAQSPGTTTALAVLEKAKTFYRIGKFDSTVATISAYLRVHGKEESAQYLVPLLMESALRQKDFDFVIRLFDIYVKKFPSSPFIPRLWYINGVALARRALFGDAVRSFSKAITLGVTPELDSLARENTSKICNTVFTIEELSELCADGQLHISIAEILEFYRIKKLIAAQQNQMARVEAESFRKKYPNSRFLLILRDLTKALDLSKNEFRLGLLAPVSGYEADIGRNVVQGVQIAIDEFNASSSVPIRLQLYDTQGDMITTARRVNEIFRNRTTVVIGPLLSRNAIVAASMLMNNPQALMITPTATDDGIAQLAPTMFQLNVTLAVLAKKIALYAIQNLNIRDLAILAPLSEYGLLMSENFKKVAIAAGAEIVAEEYYSDGTIDFSNQFKSMRRKIARKIWDRKALERGLDPAAVRRNARADTLFVTDSTILVGGIFVPAEGEEAAVIASHVQFNRIKTQLLGSTGWHSQKIITEGRKYVNNAIFSTNFPTDEKSQQWLDFVRKYTARYNVAPDRIAALGYDAAVIALKALREKGMEADPKELAQWLSKVKSFEAASGTITFDPQQRCNTEAAIIKIKDDTFIRVE